MLTDPNISIVVPLYNEIPVLQELIDRLDKLVKRFDGSIEVIFVDDGSRDGTGPAIQKLSLFNPGYVSVELSRNFGHPAAITAGLEHAKATDYVMIMDGDLQDPPELLFEFLQIAGTGYEVVYGVRKKRKEHLFKKGAYFFYYRLLKRLSGIEIPLDSGDFCLLSRKAVDALNSMPEKSRFVRGMRAWIGFRQVGMEYERDSRKAGSSKYSIRRLMRLAIDGIFNFSNLPIRFIFFIGMAAMLIAAAYLGYALFQKVYNNVAPKGFTGLLAVIVLFSGVQLMSLGVIGEYVLRIFFQTKQRPVYVVKSLIRNQTVGG